MKISVCIAILDSQEAFRRQCLNWERIGIPNDVEIILCDDGSKIPLTYSGPLPIKIIRREPILWPDGTRKWTSSLARQDAVRASKGEYVFCYDLDHIMTADCLDAIRKTKSVRVSFQRRFGLLLEDGTLTQDIQKLYEYGFPEERYKARGLRLGSHPNQYAMRREVFEEIGGYHERTVLTKHYPQGEDGIFKKGWCEYERRTGNQADEYRPILYMFPCGYYCGHVDYDKFGIFHTLSRANSKNRFHTMTKLGGEKQAHE